MTDQTLTTVLEAGGQLAMDNHVGVASVEKCKVSPGRLGSQAVRHVLTGSGS